MTHAAPPTPSYGLREVARLLGLSPARVRAWVRAGLVAPQRGRRGELRFGFRELSFLRRVRDLPEQRVAPRRLQRALVRLREQLPPERALSELALEAAGGRLVVREGSCLWSPDSGQLVFDFHPALPGRRVVALPQREGDAGSGARCADDWYQLGCDLEPADPARAQAAYTRALALDPQHLEAHVNLGCLHHEAGHLAEAEAHYRAALATCEGDATAHFDLAVVLEDQGREAEARAAYEACLASDPACAEAHYNLARLYERAGDAPGVIRHLMAYRRITG